MSKRLNNLKVMNKLSTKKPRIFDFLGVIFMVIELYSIVE